MQEEIKEILEFDFESQGERIEINEYERNILKDYITNLQKEIEELREDNYAYHQLMKIQNEREYRSKFLKEFQEEFGKNVLPDYDEIYKRYDKLKKENKELKELCDKYEEEHSTTFELWKNSLLEKKNLQEENERLKEENKHIFANVNDDELLISNAMNYAEAQDYKSRNEKAIELLKEFYDSGSTPLRNISKAYEVLQGVDKE